MRRTASNHIKQHVQYQAFQNYSSSGFFSIQLPPWAQAYKYSKIVYMQTLLV